MPLEKATTIFLIRGLIATIGVILKNIWVGIVIVIVAFPFPLWP